MQVAAPQSLVTIPGFTGWSLFPTVVRGRIASPRLFYRRQDGCYCDFAVDTVTYDGMSGSPLVTEQGDVIGLITTAGTGKFRGLSFGTTFEGAAAFLRKAGLTFSASY
jgi:Trypsin-like peptidase domain